ncbi:MAG: hypothetical protein EHM72_03300 [Calditrichaeota bacterium]|nr:MAG: hypothetical protein EHM72_03300 [Calditrichota bacterium]
MRAGHKNKSIRRDVNNRKSFRDQPTSGSSRPVSDFYRLISEELSHQGVSSILELTYDQEIRIKNSAIRRFFEQHQLPGAGETIIPSPLPRHYRTTSKRRIEYRQNQVLAGLDNIELEALPNQEHLYLLEPESHRLIYDFILSFLQKSAFLTFAKHLNYLIIRSDGKRHSIIFNVDRFEGEIIHKAKLLANHLRESDLSILSVFMYLDPSRSDYFLESRRPHAAVDFKKLYGPDKLSIEVSDKRFDYEPTAFSQINLSILPEFIRVVKELLPVDEGGLLVDLYCGYGLFCLHLADKYRSALGIDSSAAAVRAAKDNQRFLLPSSDISFYQATIDKRALQRFLPAPGAAKEYILLDPPRQGVAHGVIQALAERKPAAVLHIFCGIEQIPKEAPIWLRSGYQLERIVPLDLFPGTANIETCLLFKPKSELSGNPRRFASKPGSQKLNDQSHTANGKRIYGGIRANRQRTDGKLRTGKTMPAKRAPGRKTLPQ